MVGGGESAGRRLAAGVSRSGGAAMDGGRTCSCQPDAEGILATPKPAARQIARQQEHGGALKVVLAVVHEAAAVQVLTVATMLGHFAPRMVHL